ncbi:MAG: flavodoxin family protein [Telluria sp.]
MVSVRKGQAPAPLGRDEFRLVFHGSFMDPAFRKVGAELAAVEEIAWENYRDGHKAPVTAKAGPGFADPDYELSVEWRAARDRLLEADQRQKDAATPSRVLLINGSARNDGTCPGEISKTFRLTQLTKEVLEAEGIETDVLDLSLLTSDYDRHIHPCKGCVSTAMPLCHWPCSCYPNHGMRQTNDWMNEIYEKWVSAHAIVILTPVYWYQTPAVLKLMIDRLVCADGGNPDPTSTHGKDPKEAKELELAGWPYPRHLAGRVFSVVAHGDASGTENLRRILTDWMTDIGMHAAGHHALLDDYIGYYEPYATSHQELDADVDFQEDVQGAAIALVNAVKLLRAGKFVVPDAGIHESRPK